MEKSASDNVEKIDNGQELPEQDASSEKTENNREQSDKQAKEAILSKAILPKEERANAVISVRDLYKIYRVGEERVHALNGVSFDIRKGEFCAIVGTSGSGKSTLLNMLAGLEPPSMGNVFINGTNIVGRTEDELVSFRREHVGFIFQSFNLIQSMSAIENVALPLVFRGEAKSMRNKKAAILLHMMGLSKHMFHRPNEMSGGQQQRVGIARALVVNPNIIFADEPTGNLDSNTSVEIMNLIQDLSKRHGQTFIMVTHDDNLAEYGDRIFHIRDGEIRAVEEGKQRYQVRMANEEGKHE